MAERTKKEIRMIVGLLPVADGLALVGALILMPALAKQLTYPSGWNALLFVVFYTLFCIGVYLIRKLEPSTSAGSLPPPKFFLDSRVRGVLAFLFGLLMMSTVAYQLGYFTSIQSIRTAGLDEGDSSALFVYMPGALLGFSMLYILVLAFPVKESVPPGSRYSAIFTFFGSLLVNSMLVLCAAQAKTLFGEMDLLGIVLVWIVVLAVLIVSFAPPRILFQSKFAYPSNLLSFSILLLTLSWLVVS